MTALATTRALLSRGLGVLRTLLDLVTKPVKPLVKMPYRTGADAADSTGRIHAARTVTTSGLWAMMSQSEARVDQPTAEDLALMDKLWREAAASAEAIQCENIFPARIRAEIRRDFRKQG